MHPLDTLTRAPAERVKALAEDLIPHLEPIEVAHNRIGLVMLPMRDPVKGGDFYLGEVLVAEARVRARGGEGYAACLGRDLEQALALALIDAALAAGHDRARLSAFIEREAEAQQAADDQLLRRVEATRVELETF